MNSQSLPETFAFSDAVRQDWYMSEKDEQVLLWDASLFEKQKMLVEAKRNKAEVWRCEEKQSQLPFVAKIIPQDFARTAIRENDTEQPWADILTTKYLNRVSGSSLFVQHLGCLEDADNLYYCTELASKGDLWDFLTPAIKNPRSNPQQYAARVVHYMRQVLQGVAELHALHLVHLDLSIENVLVRDNDSIALVDFGMSLRLLPGPDGTTFLPIRRQRGKANYMAPEVREHRSYQGMPADVYACGVMLLFLVVSPMIGSYPWDIARRPDSHRVLNLFLQQGVPGLLRHFGIADRVPAELVALLNSMLHNDPLQRPTAEDCLSFAFFRQGSQINVGAAPSTPSTPTSPATAAHGFAAAGTGGDVDMGCGF